MFVFVAGLDNQLTLRIPAPRPHHLDSNPVVQASKYDDDKNDNNFGLYLSESGVEISFIFFLRL